MTFGVSRNYFAPAIRQLSFLAFHQCNVDDVINEGFEVISLVRFVKRNHPDVVPKVEVPVGLLSRERIDGKSTQSIDVDDFTLATLMLSHESGQLTGGNAPTLLAYAYVGCVIDGIATSSWLESALQYVLTQTTYLSASLRAKSQALEERARSLQPLAERGLAFKPGRQPGALGPLARALDRYIAKHPNAKATEIWKHFMQKQPRGMTFIDNNFQGKIIEYDGQPNDPATYKRFVNAVRESKLRRAGKTKAKVTE